MTAYYNDNDPAVVAWLRELIKRNLIASGEVDERDIADVRPDELAGYTQCHFFAGIGVWSYALRRAGWPDDRPVWTGSCPCQPFSTAGKGEGLADERHLWPAWFHLIEQCRPVQIFGEQVASDDGLAWLDVVRSDLEGAAYAVGSADLCAAGVGAPHIRQRLFFVANTGDCGRALVSRHWQTGTSEHSEASKLGNTAESRFPFSVHSKNARGVVGDEGRAAGVSGVARDARQAAWVGGFWAGADWVWCRDERWRPIESGTFPLAHGAPARVVRLRGYGNAINAEVATEFIRAYLEVTA